jgi:hypothetical protein
MTGEEIRRNLAEFASRWDTYLGTERAEAQPFLEDLLRCFGTARRDQGIRFEDFTGGGFLDLHWPGVCIVEMKRPSEGANLEHFYRTQALPYWERSGAATHGPARFVVMCSFNRFQVWQPGFHKPRAEFALKELAENLDALLFLAGDEPVFLRSHAELTRGAARKVTDMLRSLDEREAAEPDVLRDFALQSVWCMFAEDLQMLPGHLFTRLVDGLLQEPRRSSREDLGLLFQYLNAPADRPTEGLYAGLQYVDGALFLEPARVHLNQDELRLLRDACDSPWNLVEPEIFGSLLEGALGRERQWALGAHYTAKPDILKVVLPTVVEPWRERIAACKTVADAQAAQDELVRYVVLDPACGSGNFLYVAYRELRRIERDLRDRLAVLRDQEGLPPQQSLSFFPITNMKGIEIEPFAVKLARVTLWMGHRLAVGELGVDERVLPLVNLSGIRRGDALKVDWPRADAIISNPPYIGTKLMRSRLGDDYVAWVGEEFGIGVKDYAVYWIRKAHDALSAGGRAGVVATNSIREGRNREAALEYVAEEGGVIVEAVSSQPWSGAANVHVSIVNWVKKPQGTPTRHVLDGLEVASIAPTLRSQPTLGAHLSANEGKQFFGVVPGGAGFILSATEADELLAQSDVDYSQIVRPFLVGADITRNPDQTPSRFVIDFHFNVLEDAMAYPAALEVVRRLVRPHRRKAKRKAYREKWWRLEEPIVAMRKAVVPLARYIACPAQGKRLYMIWCHPHWLASNLTSVFAFEDDYAMGILASSLHARWAIEQSTKLKSDPRYTSASFMTFPWPSRRSDEIADLGKRLIDRRSEICSESGIGLTKLYNALDEGAYADLKRLHDELDEAVAAAYGWPKSAAHDPAESNRRLLELNRAIVAGKVEYRPFG